MTGDVASQKLANMQAQQQSALAAIATAQTEEELEAAHVRYLGRKAYFGQVGKLLGEIPPEERPAVGKTFNAIKQTLEDAYNKRGAEIRWQAQNERLRGEWLDLTLPAPGPHPGSLHPVTQIRSEIEDLFTSLGFAVLDGPEVETEYYNFHALNITADHPARDMQDTFWLTDG